VIAGWYGPGPGFELQIQWSAGEIPGFANELNLGLPKACKVTSVVVLPKKKEKKKKKRENYWPDFVRSFVIGCAFLSFFPDSVTY
jgi:hypothetical protein